MNVDLAYPNLMKLKPLFNITCFYRIRDREGPSF